MVNVSALEKWITWGWEDDWEGIDEYSEEHVWASMKEGYTSGELCRNDKDGFSIRGWWERKVK